MADARNTVMKADLDEMLFEDRERGYGAYQLRRKNRGYTIAGALIVAVAFVLLTWGPKLLEKYFPNDEANVGEEKIDVALSMSDLPPPPPLDESKPLPPPPPKVEMPPPQVKTVSFKIPEPKPKEELKEAEATINEIDSVKKAPVIAFEDKKGSDMGVFQGEIDGKGSIPEVIVDKKEPEKPKPAPEKPKEELPDINKFVMVQQEPKPVNMDEIKKAIGYPKMAKEADISGTVTVRILVDENGNYRDHKITKTPHPMLAQAVEQHLNKLKFTPAVQGGKPIKFWVNVPFQFILN